MKGRKGTRIGTPPSIGSGVWRTSEAYAALRRGEWPRWDIFVYGYENQFESTTNRLASFYGSVYIPGGRAFTSVWQFSTNAGQTWNPWPGSSKSSIENVLSMSGLTVADDGMLVRLSVTSGLRQEFGDIMMVRFDTVAIQFDEQPVDSVAEIGQVATFYAPASAYGVKYSNPFAVNYQWQEFREYVDPDTGQVIEGYAQWFDAGSNSPGYSVIVNDESIIGRSYRVYATTLSGQASSTIISNTAQIVAGSGY